MTTTIILEDYSINSSYTTRSRRNSIKKFFHWNTNKSESEPEVKENVDVNTVDKINSLYKNNDIDTVQRNTVSSTKTKKLRKFLSFSKKNHHQPVDITVNNDEDDEIIKNNSFKLSLKRTLSKMKIKKSDQKDKSNTMSETDGSNTNKDASECYNKFKSNKNSVTTKSNDIPPSIKMLNFDEQPLKIGKSSVRRQNSFNKKKTILDIGGNNPSTNLDPFSPLTEDTNTLLEPFEAIEFLKDDVFDKENAFDFPKLSSFNKTPTQHLDVVNNHDNSFTKDNIQALLFGSSQKDSLSTDKTTLTVSEPSPIAEENILDLTDIELSPIHSDNINPETLSPDEMNSSETLKESPDFSNLKPDDFLELSYTDLVKLSELNHAEYDAQDAYNVKCLAVPTFRDDDLIGLGDYIKGYELGKFTQLDVLEHMKKELAKNKEIMEKMRDTFDDFRNPAFYTEGEKMEEDEESKYYTCDDSYDTSSLNQTIRSIGTSRNSDTSKLKFNLLSEVFYYDKNVESKGDKNLSVLETVKKENKTAEKQDDSILLQKENDNLLLNSNSTDVSIADVYDVLDFSKLDNITHLLSIGNKNNDKVQITSNDTDTPHWSSSNLYESSDLSIDTLKRIAMNLTSDEALEHLAQFSFPFKDQITKDLEVDGCLADVESMGSPNLTLPDHKEVLPVGFFSQFFTCSEDPETKSSGDTLSNTYDFIKLSPGMEEKEPEVETLSFRSILKKRVNQNESLELESLLKLMRNEEIITDPPQQPEASLKELRMDQLKRFYSTDFYPDLENDEDYVRSLRSTQSKYNNGLNIKQLI